jgi:hypothetical protein
VVRLDRHATIAAGALARDLLTIQRRAYTVEAELLGDDRIPALHETLPDLVAANLRWWVAVAGLRVSRYRYPALPRSTMAATGPPPSGP